MSEVVNFPERRAGTRPKPLETVGGEAGPTRPSHQNAPSGPSKEDVHRAILLLDLAGQHVRLIVKKINDPSRRENFEAQIATMEELLQVARQLASAL